MPKLGETLYFPDMQNGKVMKGIALEYKINEQGFDVVTLRTDDGKFYAPFMAYCRKTEKEMKNDLPSLVALNKEIITIQNRRDPCQDARQAAIFALNIERWKGRSKRRRIKSPLFLFTHPKG